MLSTATDHFYARRILATAFQKYALSISLRASIISSCSLPIQYMRQEVTTPIFLRNAKMVVSFRIGHMDSRALILY